MLVSGLISSFLLYSCFLDLGFLFCWEILRGGGRGFVGFLNFFGLGFVKLLSYDHALHFPSYFHMFMHSRIVCLILTCECYSLDWVFAHHAIYFCMSYVHALPCIAPLFSFFLEHSLLLCFLLFFP